MKICFFLHFYICFPEFGWQKNLFFWKLIRFQRNLCWLFRGSLKFFKKIESRWKNNLAYTCQDEVFGWKFSKFWKKFKSETIFPVFSKYFSVSVIENDSYLYRRMHRLKNPQRIQNLQKLFEFHRIWFSGCTQNLILRVQWNIMEKNCSDEAIRL